MCSPRMWAGMLLMISFRLWFQRSTTHRIYILKVTGMQYKPQLSVTHKHYKLHLSLFFTIPSVVYLAVIAPSCNSQRTDCSEHRGALLCRGLLLASVFKPVLPICLISKHHAKLRSLRRTTSESQVCWGYQAPQWARSKATKTRASARSSFLNAEISRVGELWVHSITICSSHPCWYLAK